MKLYTAYRAPNPRRVLMFMHEKGVSGIETVSLD
ncbi:MAG: glutathione S-transferase family protein, partial [Ottowia sp.]|nr:glutathione S-transferase family protein [Ottowia sp.]